MNGRPSRREAGAAAEALAARLLEQQGLRIVGRNFRTRLGEIDLIAREGETLVFIEVRKRSHPGFGGAGESITRAKQRRIIAAAKSYMRHATAPTFCRFDAVLISPEGEPEWIRGAFME